jgi:septal ring-binding cell division protein DamX
MNKIIYVSAVLVIISLLFPACSSVHQTSGKEGQKNKPDSLYVFDQSPAAVKDTTQMQPKQEVQNTAVTFYTVQIGAFSTKERANEFADSSKTKIQDQITVFFNADINLYVVQLAKHYTTREEAENEKDILRQFPDFKDAWVVAEQK